MVTVEDLEALTKSWVIHGDAVPETAVRLNNEPTQSVAMTGQKEPPFAWHDGWGTAVGQRFLGHHCRQQDADAMRIIEIVRSYPVRPYLVKGGGSGFNIPSGWGKDEKNWEIVKEFSTLWWSAAGDAVIARYGERLPIVWREIHEREVEKSKADSAS